MPSSKSTRDADPSLLKDLLAIKFPRCAVCDVLYAQDDDDEIEIQEDKQSDEHYFNLAQKLIPLAECKCTCKMISCTIDDDDMFTSAELSRILKQFQNFDESAIVSLLINKFCHANNIKTCKGVAFCKACFDKSVEVSDEVIEHDYRSESQPNQKFSINFKCPFCKKLYTKNFIRNLRKGDRMSEAKQMEIMQMRGVYKNTMQFVGFKKKVRNILKQTCSDEKDRLQGVSDATRNTVLEWVNDDDVQDSDDCFSDTDVGYVQSKPRHIETTPGELKEYLMQQCPHFRQEQEDRIFAEKLQRESEGFSNDHKASAEQAPSEADDAALAKKLQSEYIAKSKGQKKSPILDFLVKGPNITDTSNGKSSKCTRVRLEESSKRKEKPKEGIQKFLTDILSKPDSDDSDKSQSSKEGSRRKKRRKQKTPTETRVIDSIEILSDGEEDEHSDNGNKKQGFKKSPGYYLQDKENDDESVVIERKTRQMTPKKYLNKKNDVGKTKTPEIIVMTSKDSDDDSMPGLTPRGEEKETSEKENLKEAIDEDAISRLQWLGSYNREQCISALCESGNDPELAANILLGYNAQTQQIE
ncbi:hypothetical protein CTEN210_16851 [Chaetoceros tenuissimus]|uniref:UBA domain-containing protein n=1 Tax=Chaetoceros tenuissimus TaxID=426638 RepID=A0AAD3DBL3_9STRA|nr:hypothetical protein CTEN210_16851 [Chaetoceros tenuissimus]